MRRNRTDLTNFLKRQICDDDCDPSPLLRTLAKIPFPLIVTTNYDRLMEAALRLEGKEEGKDFITLVQPPTGWDLLNDRQLSGKFEDWTAFPGTLVYKIHGSFSGTATVKKEKWIAETVPSPVVITEEDYITFMTVMGAETAERIGVPPFIRSRMANSMLLFLGYGLEDWDIRGLYNGLIQSIPSYSRRDSFAIQKDATSLWQTFWTKRNILVRNYDLYGFAQELHEARFGERPDWALTPAGSGRTRKAVSLAAEQPYRFLDNYRFTPEDVKVFHGRKRETALLVSELTTRRLVVLFAPTGTGKSSLINAGVRPKLEAMKYKTVMVRVGRDPDQALRAALTAENLIAERAQPLSLGECVRAAIATASRPLVIFLDQFEEFFLYVQREQPERALRFISDVAALYRDRDAGAHFAFSLREDFFIEMDVFRDEIPTIFQQNSGLRLRPLQRDQARDAIREPALQFSVTFEEKLVAQKTDEAAEKPRQAPPEVLLDDLSAIGPNGLIAPVHLQIVCDTLWRKRTGDRITADLYRSEGGVVRILDERFRADIASCMSDDELVLFAEILPLLRSDEERGTKSVVSIAFLSGTVEERPGTDWRARDQAGRPTAFAARCRGHRQLGERLSRPAGWIIFWAARSTYLRRALARAMKAAADRGSLDSTAAPGMPPTERDIEARFMPREEFDEISNNWKTWAPSGIAGLGPAKLDLNENELRFLFDASLEHGRVEFWRARAIESGID